MSNTENKEKVVLNVYTDGVYFPEPGLGGIASIIIFPDETTREFSRGFENTDTHRMKITAFLAALDEVADLVEQKTIKPGTHINLITDSENVVETVKNGWLYKWQANGWYKLSGKPVKNPDLLEELILRLNHLQKCGVTLGFVSIAEIGTPALMNPCVLNPKQATFYHKECNKLAVEAFRQLEKSLSKKE